MLGVRALLQPDGIQFSSLLLFGVLCEIVTLIQLQSCLQSLYIDPFFCTICFARATIRVQRVSWATSADNQLVQNVGDVPVGSGPTRRKTRQPTDVRLGCFAHFRRSIVLSAVPVSQSGGKLI